MCVFVPYTIKRTLPQVLEKQEHINANEMEVQGDGIYFDPVTFTIMVEV